MVDSRLAVVFGLIALATVVIAADSALSTPDSLVSALMTPDASLLLLPLAAIVAYATTGTRGAPAPVRRRRVNRARLRARRAAS
jgi:hypothetical protein